VQSNSLFVLLCAPSVAHSYLSFPVHITTAAVEEESNKGEKIKSTSTPIKADAYHPVASSGTLLPNNQVHATLPISTSHVEEARATTLLRALSPDSRARVANEMQTGNGEDIVAQTSIGPCLREKFKCLEPGEWLNDEVINYYITLLNQRDENLCVANTQRRRSHIFNSFFMAHLCSVENKVNFGTEYSYKMVKGRSKKAPGECC